MAAKKKSEHPLVVVGDEVTALLRQLSLGRPVEFVYFPLEYARQTYADYAGRYGTGHKPVVLLGMNPGPWGMAQTGVPFGEVNAVRDWLRIRGDIGRPAREHPKRPVQGFACLRCEVSGTRLWGWARDTFGSPQQFFKRFFVANYCPMLFLDAAGRNLTPDKLKASERAAIESVCDQGLRQTVEYLRPEFVIGLGNYAEGCARRALAGTPQTIGRVLHPSPASPLANRNWGRQAERQLRDLGIEVP